jgi:sugar diacid utilization regulator
MSSVPTSIYLVEGIIDQGLPFVATYLIKIVNKHIVIADSFGHIHYPNKESSMYLGDEIFSVDSSRINEDGYYYHETDKYLVYQVGQNNACAFVIVKNVNHDQIMEIIACIAEARLAIKNYFINMEKVRINTEKFERKFAEHLLVKSNVNIRDVLKMNGIDLDISQPYCVKLVQIDKAEHKIDLRLICSDINDYVKRRKLEIIPPIIWGEGVMFIIPAVYEENTLEVDPEWPKLSDSFMWKNAADKKFNTTISIGLGQKYTLRDLHKSHYEARVALALPKLMGRTGVVQRFGDLGIFSHLFSQDIASLKSYCLKIIGGLMDYDQKIEAELLPTLRAVLDNCCNWKLSAERLFIHVNTLHYRVAKIEQLLDIDLARMDTRVNLFTTIKVWDTLRMLGFLDKLPEENEKILSSCVKVQGQKRLKAI